MKKVLVALVAVLGLTGLYAAASAHMWGGGNAGPQGRGPGYGWNCPMSGEGMSHMGWEARMGRVSNMNGRDYAGCCRYGPGKNPSASSNPTDARPAPAP